MEISGATTNSLSLGGLSLGTGEHTFTVEVLDCPFKLTDHVVVTIQNSPPTVSALSTPVRGTCTCEI